eukprot:3157164-Alexandrium_andersonii.AAC.1
MQASAHALTLARTHARKHALAHTHFDTTRTSVHPCFTPIPHHVSAFDADGLKQLIIARAGESRE